jgi:hypothetical protein
VLLVASGPVADEPTAVEVEVDVEVDVEVEVEVDGTVACACWPWEMPAYSVPSNVITPVPATAPMTATRRQIRLRG